VGRGEADDIVSGRSHGHHRAILMTASGQFRGRLRAVSRGRRHGYRTKPRYVRLRFGADAFSDGRCPG
jgi:hypothetical protein